MNKQATRIIPSILAGLMVLLFGSMFIPGAMAETYIVVHPSIGVDAISTADLQRIYTGKKVSWETGQRVYPVLLDADDALDYFVGTYLNRTPFQFENFWKKMVFTGRGMMPKVFNNNQDVIDFVAGTEGAIGFVASRQVSGNVRFVTVSE